MTIAHGPTVDRGTSPLNHEELLRFVGAAIYTRRSTWGCNGFRYRPAQPIYLRLQTLYLMGLTICSQSEIVCFLILGWCPDFLVCSATRSCVAKDPV